MVRIHINFERKDWIRLSGFVAILLIFALAPALWQIQNQVKESLEIQRQVLLELQADNQTATP